MYAGVKRVQASGLIEQEQPGCECWMFLFNLMQCVLQLTVGQVAELRLTMNRAV
jgi:hypothetical protein